MKWVKITDLDGKDMYPIDPRKPFILELVAYNNGPDVSSAHGSAFCSKNRSFCVENTFSADNRARIGFSIKIVTFQYEDNKVDVRLFEYQKSWQTGKCGWAEIPTFGAL